MKITHNVAVHKAEIPMLKGESISDFTQALSRASRKDLMSSLSLTEKGAGAYVMEAFKSTVVLSVYEHDASDTRTEKSGYYAMGYKRDVSKSGGGAFAFTSPKKVRQVVTWEEESALQKNAGNLWDGLPLV